MHDIIASTDLSTLMKNLINSFSRGDLRTCFSVFSLIGLIAGLIIRSSESNLIINILFGIAGAVLGGYAYMLTIGSFYGVPGSLAASAAGTVIVLLIKRAFPSGNQS